MKLLTRTTYLIIVLINQIDIDVVFDMGKSMVFATDLCPFDAMTAVSRWIPKIFFRVQIS